MTQFTDKEIEVINTYLGRGYKGYESYASASSMTLPLFDLKSGRVDDYVDLLRSTTYESEVIRGKSMQEYIKNLSMSAGIDAGYAFLAEIKSRFAMVNSGSSKRTNEYISYDINNTLYRITLKGNVPLSEQFQEDLNSLEATTLFETYGTHYLRSTWIGGRISFSTTIDTYGMTSDQRNKFELVAKGTVANWTGTGGVEINREDKDISDQMQANSKVRVWGGDPKLGRDIERAIQGNTVSDIYQQWGKTVEERPNISDFGNNQGLVPIYELATGTRKKQLEEQWKAYWQDKSDKEEGLIGPDIVKKDHTIVLSSRDGRYLSYSHSGFRYYFAKLGNNPLSHQLDTNNEYLCDKNIVHLKTTEQFKGIWNQCKLLGAFADSYELYYWSDYGDNTKWIIEKAAGTAQDKEIAYGEKVYIKNKSYNQYLVLARDGYLTTKKIQNLTDEHTWVIHRPK
jgi:hypothetical protein